MATLLRIDASARLDGSYSRQLADDFTDLWRINNPEGEMVLRDLAREPVPHLDNDTINDFQNNVQSSPQSYVSEQLIAELHKADQIVIASPVYNLTLPSTLKAYMDHVVRSGKTFEVTEDGVSGCLKNKKAVIITTSGYPFSKEIQYDHQTHYLKDVLRFIGIKDIETITFEGTALEEKIRNQYLSKAQAKLSRLFQPEPASLWLGQFSAEDKSKLTSLRDRQAEAIMSGDAKAYTDLCTEDVQLLLPGHDLVVGREKFLQMESKLFSENIFVSFKKSPIKIERSGDMVVETGTQEVMMSRSYSGEGLFAAQQKYMHLFRQTEDGWRFCALMSNPS